MDERSLAVWLKERLCGEAGRNDWRAVLGSGLDGVLSRPFKEVVSASAFETALDELSTEERLSEIARGAVRVGFARVAESAMSDDRPVGRVLDDDARSRLEALVCREGLIDEAWVDVIFSQEATEELFANILFRSLQDFSDTIPQLVQNVTPAVFGKLASALGSKTGGVRDRMKEELRSRLEPEIRKFVTAASRRLLDGTARFVKSGLDREGAREARKNLLRHALGRPVSSYARHFDEAALADIEGVFDAVAKTPEAREGLRERLRRAHARLLEEHGDTPLRDVLTAHGLEPTVKYDAWAEATWPVVSAFVQSEGVEAFFERLSKEILERVAEG